MPQSIQPAAGAEQKSWLDRLLSIVTDVHAGEGLSALLLALNVLALLAFYSVLKIIRDALILSEGGAEWASYSAAGQALVLLGLVPAYGWVASRVNRAWLISSVTLFFALHLVIFWMLGLAGVRIGIAFYIWAGVFNVVVIAQLWAFANDVYTNERGKRLFPLISVGASLGAVAGAALTTVLFAEGVGAYRLMLGAAAGLAATIALTLWVNRRERDAGRDAAGGQAEKPLGKAGGFQLVLRERYLLLIALMILVVNLVNTLGGYLLNAFYRTEALRATVPGAGADAVLTEAQAAAVRSMIGTMSGTVQTSVNVLAFVIAVFLTSRILKLIGVRGALFILPLVALGTYSAMAFVPIFSIVRIGKILENSTDYSIQNTARHALFLPTSREAKFKAKQAIDTFFWRAGDFLQAIVVFLGLQYGFEVRGFAIVNACLVVLWLLLVVLIVREHRVLTAADPSEQAA